MSKKDKKIEIQLADAKVTVGKDSYEGYVLTIGKKVIGEITAAVPQAPASTKRSKLSIGTSPSIGVKPKRCSAK